MGKSMDRQTNGWLDGWIDGWMVIVMVVVNAYTQMYNNILQEQQQITIIQMNV